MQDVLAYCESFVRWPPHVDYAARLAARLGGHVTGMYVAPSPSDMPVPYETPELIADLAQALQEKKEEALSAGPSFEAYAGERGATSASWQVAEGQLPQALKFAGNWHDVLVIGRARHAPWGSVATVGNMVLGAETPCIVVPDEPLSTMTLQTVAIAWNGSMEAIRATHAAIPLLRHARRVTILHGAQHPPAGMRAWQPPFDLPAYLARHGVPCESELLSEPEDSAGDGLLRMARRTAADLLVMGAYGHTRLREWVLGGATRGVLEAMDIPVFMQH
ncbi:universal stress protein [Dyella japonica]|uniref:Nucleotide-binding universal stress UspA family protein n=1 Tax=Dyella japonica TaxID=231455 RepID=A0ABV2JP30_9GAMM